MVHNLIQSIFQLLSFLVIVHVILSYVVPPSNRIREIIGSIVNPMLAPIHRIIPTVSNFDLSPIILLFIIQILEYIILALV